MYIKYLQTAKSLSSASFVIKDAANGVVGSIEFAGGTASLKVAGHTTLNNTNVTIDINGSKIILKPLLSFNQHSYQIIKQGENIGNIAIIPKGTFLKPYTVHELYYDGKIYTKYFVGLGEEGFKYPIYNDEGIQEGLIEKACIVIDDLHIFDGYVRDESFLECLSIFVAYTYVIGFYKPGTKVIKGKEKNITITKSKKVLSKYDPNFKVECNGRGKFS